MTSVILKKVNSNIIALIVLILTFNKQLTQQLQVIITEQNF